MNRAPWIATLTLLLAGWTLGACGASHAAIETSIYAEPVDTTPKPLPAAQLYFPGEAMFFEFHFRRFLVGRASLEVGQPVVAKGRPALTVRSELKSARWGKLAKDIHDDIVTLLDTERGRTMEQTATMVFGNSHNDYKIRCAGRWVFVEIHRKGPKYQQGMYKRFARTRKHNRLPEGEIGFDVHAVLGALRAWKGRVGERLYFYAISGSRIWRTDLEFLKYDEYTMPRGRTYRALRFVGSTQRLNYKMQPDPRLKEPRTFDIWLSDDPRRVPLAIEGKTELGTAAVRLIEYQP